MTEWNAEEYDRISALQRQMANEALALVRFKGSEHVLDVGCGSGRITAGLVRLVPHGEVLGVDASSEMITYAAKTAAENGLPRLRYEVADARSLPFQAAFDAVVSFNALHWIPEQEMALKGIHRALRPGGWVQLRLVPKAERTSIEDTLEAVTRSEHWTKYFPDHVNPYLQLTADSYVDLAERCGFQVETFHVSDNAWDFGSRQEFDRFLKVTTVAWTKGLPEEEKPLFVSDVLDHYGRIVGGRPGEEHVFRFYQMDLKMRQKGRNL